MSYKQGHDAQGSYVDNIRVKISERYKPPHRINLPISYTQRLNLNKQIEDSIPKYEFTLEKSVIERMSELKAARASAYEERKTRLNQAKEINKKIQEQKEKEKVKEEQEIKSTECVVTTNIPTYTTPVTMGINTTNQNHMQSYSISNNILMPTQVTTNAYTNILTPIPLTSQMHSSKPVDKSPFNISDFEDDTSSPFDNMELKSINDLEELAQVLKTDGSSHHVNPSHSYQPSLVSSSQIQPSCASYTGHQYNYNSNMPSYMTQHTNGYYYPDATQSFHQPYMYPKQSTTDNSYINPTLETSKSNCKSVPDIMKALETELNNTYINYQVTSKVDVVMNNATSKATNTVHPKPQSEDVLRELPKSDQELCKSIGSMGFPVDRVARTIKILGTDQKKVI